MVATRGDAIRLRYDILSLIDRGLVSPNHFDHILVCDQLPLTLEGMAEAEVQQAFNDACFDFKAATNVSDEAAAAAVKNFSAKLKALENSSPRGQVQEVGGCWVCFDDNAHPYVRALLKAGRVEVNKVGRYLGKLDELDRLRDLGERQKSLKPYANRSRMNTALAAVTTAFVILGKQMSCRFTWVDLSAACIESQTSRMMTMSDGGTYLLTLQQRC